LQGAADVLREYDEMEWVRRAVLEFGNEVLVEVPRLAGFDVDEQRPAPDLARHGEGPEKNVLEQARTESSALVADINPQAGKQRDGLWVPTSSFSQTDGCIRHVELSHAPCVVSDDGGRTDFGDDEDLRCSDRDRLPGMAVEPLGLL
jgi:hypothetical protein